jgi:hypothetical protein
MRISMRILSFTLVALFSAGTLLAVTPKYWTVASAEDFLAGELEGIAVSGRGGLAPAPAVTKVGSFDEPFVLSQTVDSAGNRYFGTGNNGRLYRLRGDQIEVLFTAPEPEIYALTYMGGALYVGTSPNGKIYRVDPASGSSSVFHDPEEAYIWALAAGRNGELIAATGTNGRLFRIDSRGTAKIAFEAPETHIRSLAVRNDGTILAGGSGSGRIYEIGATGGRALFQSSLTEITSIVWDEKNATGWAAGVTNVLPATAPARTPAAAAQGQAAQQQASSQQPEAGGTATVEITYSTDTPQQQAQPAQAGPTPGAELYRIDRDGFVEAVRKFDREIVYALGLADAGGLFVATGPQGRIYRLLEGELSLVTTVPEKQIVSISNSGRDYFVTTTNSGAAYRFTEGRFGKSELRSAVRDTDRFSRFGHFKVEGANLGNPGLTMAFRSGNTSTPDVTWSDWQSVRASSGNITAPPARYLQWRMSFDAPAAGTKVDRVTVAYINRNVAPVIESLTIHDPAVVFVASNFPSSNQVLEATNPDEYGIFTSLDNPRDRNDPGKRLFRKGFRTIAWRARDENGDSLRYSVFIKPAGSANWLRLRENIEESQINFDTTQLPDGRYEVRLVATDRVDNPDQPLETSREGASFLVDNSPPVIRSEFSGDTVVIRITDELSQIGKVEYSVDAQKWMRLLPDDGIADSRSETFRLPRGEVDGRFVIVRAVDAHYNVATATVATQR